MSALSASRHRLVSGLAGLAAVAALMLVTSGPWAVPATVLASATVSAPDRTHAA